MKFKDLQKKLNGGQPLLEKFDQALSPEQEDVVPFKEDASTMENVGRFILNNVATSPGLDAGFPAVGAVKKVFDPKNKQHLKSVSDMLEKLYPDNVEMMLPHQKTPMLDAIQTGKNPNIYNHPEFREALNAAGYNHMPEKFSVLTAQNPSAKQLSKPENEKLLNQLYKDLEERGISFEKVEGNYGGMPESSVMVPHNEKVNEEVLNELAKKYNQESIAHKLGDLNKLQYVSGPNAGKFHQGKGMLLDDELAENFTRRSDYGGKFQLDFNFEELLDKVKELPISEPEKQNLIKRLLTDEAANVQIPMFDGLKKKIK
jgi:hypothetical protein